MTQHDVKQEIGRFYNEVGWQIEPDGNFQNAQYEDLRPVSAEYIARAHARVARHLPKSGRYLLDANGTRWLDGPLTTAARIGAIVACQNWRLTTAEQQHCVDQVAPALLVHSPAQQTATDALGRASIPRLVFGQA